MQRVLKALQQLDLEERILHAGALVGLIGVFLPWISRELEGRVVIFSGLQFFTGSIGIAIVALHLATIALGIVPVLGGPAMVRRRSKNFVRLLLSLNATVLTLAALSVLIHATFEFYRTELRFGIYVALVGGVVSTLYALLKLQEQRRSEVQSFFHHPEETVAPVERKDSRVPPPPPPPPPPPLPAEEHRIHSAVPVRRS